MSLFAKRNLFVVSLFIAVGFAVYSVTFHNQLFWDDTDWIVNNPFVHEVSWENVTNLFSKNTLAGIGLASNYYRPILFLTFMLNYAMGGIHPFGYHFINILLHIANAILIFILLDRGTRARFAALFTSLIFLVHPLQTEAVTYVAGRGDPLNVFFMLFALFLLVESDAGRHRWKYLASIALVPLAFLSRETAVIFPGLALVYLVAFRTQNRFWQSVGRTIKLLIPHMSVVVIYGILRLTVLNFENTLNFYSAGSANPYSEHLLVRMYTFMGVLLSYARLLILPTGLHMERSVNVYLVPWYTAVIIPATILIILGAYLWRGSFRDGSGNVMSPFRLAFFVTGWFFVNMALTSGITPVNAVLYEHWLYLALVGPVFVVGVLLQRLWDTVPKIRSIIVGGVGVVVVVFGVLSIQRNILWGNQLEFYKDILKYEPTSARINNNVGNIYYDQDNLAEAEKYYWKAAEAGDNFPQPHYNLGNILRLRGDMRGAIVEYETAIQIDPNFHYAYRGLASLYAKQGNLQNVRAMLEKLLVLVPNDPTVYLDLGRVAIVQGDRTYALKILERGLPLATGYPDIEKQMRDAYISIGGNIR
jgi:hypothetical protein